MPSLSRPFFSFHSYINMFFTEFHPFFLQKLRSVKKESSNWRMKRQRKCQTTQQECKMGRGYHRVGVTTKRWAWLVLKRVWLHHIKGIAVMKSAWSRKRLWSHKQNSFFSLQEYVNITNTAVRVLNKWLIFSLVFVYMYVYFRQSCSFICIQIFWFLFIICCSC